MTDEVKDLVECDPAPVDNPALRFAAQRVAEALRTGICPADRAFDRFLPDDLRVVSAQCWTPLMVAKHAAQWLDDLNVQTVVDIGSGVGKFCVAAALVRNCTSPGSSNDRGLSARRAPLLGCSKLTIVSASSTVHWATWRLPSRTRTTFTTRSADIRSAQKAISTRTWNSATNAARVTLQQSKTSFNARASERASSRTTGLVAGCPQAIDRSALTERCRPSCVFGGRRVASL